MSIDRANLRDEPSDLAWSDEVLRDLLTAERLRSYLAASGGDLSPAMRLYEWNAQASGSVLVTAGMVEVVVRNAMDRQLSTWAAERGHGTWFDAAPLDDRGRRDIAKARERATNFGRSTQAHGKVVAELTLGFWRYLTSQRYLTSLWIPALASAFPGGPRDIAMRRREVDRRLASLLLVRNRAAHHEPIHRRNLTNDWKVAVELAAWVHTDAGAWVSSRSTLNVVMGQRPR